MPDKCTIIYVMSDKRAGSTMLENILSKSNETVSIGELALLKHHIFRRGTGDRWNWNCSCGSPVKECVFWSRILEDIDVNAPAFNTKIYWNSKSKRILAGSFLLSIFESKLQEIDKRSVNKNTIETLYAIYRRIFSTTGKRFIIDSSKDPVQAYLLYIHQPTDINVKVIGLKRDIRAVAASKRKWNMINKKEQHKSLAQLLRNSLLYYKLCNQVLKLVREEDKLLINYEQLATDTQSQLNKIVQKTGLQPYNAPALMHIENDHTIASTPQRFSKKPIKYDNSWKQTYSNKPLLSLVGKIMNKL